mmetsp:Transcript_490/g.2016  ORF Transcript_490/g.2016 Transcript_490/m.2016 type:complete len:227 (+) Transcript_490:512-1192(+)
MLLSAYASSGRVGGGAGLDVSPSRSVRGGGNGSSESPKSRRCASPPTTSASAFRTQNRSSFESAFSSSSSFSRCSSSSVRSKPNLELCPVSRNGTSGAIWTVAKKWSRSAIRRSFANECFIASTSAARSASRLVVVTRTTATSGRAATEFAKLCLCTGIVPRTTVSGDSITSHAARSNSELKHSILPISSSATNRRRVVVFWPSLMTSPCLSAGHAVVSRALTSTA